VTALFDAGALVIAIGCLSLMAVMAMLVRTQCARRRHGIRDARLFPLGSGLVFGTLTVELVIGVSLIVLSYR
jgi:hypothetical protein